MCGGSADAYGAAWFMLGLLSIGAGMHGVRTGDQDDLISDAGEALVGNSDACHGRIHWLCCKVLWSVILTRGSPQFIDSWEAEGLGRGDGAPILSTLPGADHPNGPSQ